MDGDIDAAVEHGPLNLLGEKTAAADVPQRRRLIAVAFGLNVNEFDRPRRQRAQPVGHVVRLPERQRAGTRADAKRGHDDKIIATKHTKDTKRKKCVFLSCPSYDSRRLLLRV